MATKSKRAATTRFIPACERLESRELLAVSATLSAGVLTVKGTTVNESIVLRQANSRVSVDGLSKSFATSSIQSLIVNSGGRGHDFVGRAKSNLGTSRFPCATEAALIRSSCWTAKIAS